MRLVRELTRALVASLVVVLAVAACGGGGSGTSSTTNSTGSSSTGSSPGSVTLNWTIPTQNTDGTPLSNLAGFKLIYGQSPTDLSQAVTISNPTVATYQFTDLSPGTWYFAIVAVNTDGNESVPTNVLSQTV